MNLPNKITLARICLIPVFLFFYLADFIPYGKLIATIMFALISLTDLIDGKIARKRNLVTTLGAFMDPLADKLLVMSGLICIIAYPVTANGGSFAPMPILNPVYIGVVAVCIILAREFMITALRTLAASNGIVLKADMYGKVKTTFQFITIIYYLAYSFIVEEFYYAISGVANTVLGIVGYILLAITIILTIISGCNYMIKNKDVFKEKKKAEKESTKTDSEEIVVEVEEKKK